MEDESPTLLTSEIAAGNGSIDFQENLSQDTLVRESMSTEWTNEKHSLYLKSMESSFVDNLYNSSDLFGHPLQREHSSDPKSLRKKRAQIRISSGQFKVLRGGCWEKFNFGRDKSQLVKADGGGVLLANPWMQHFRSTRRHRGVRSSTLHAKAALGSVGIEVSGNDSVGGYTEGTDQNFVGEDMGGEKARHACSAKGMKKSSNVATSSNDQVVPFGEYHI